MDLTISKREGLGRLCGGVAFRTLTPHWDTYACIKNNTLNLEGWPCATSEPVGLRQRLYIIPVLLPALCVVE